jgi:hypothetical protein
MLRRAVPLAVTLLAIPAQAVILQGKVTSPFGRPVPGARIQLIALSAGTHSVANAVSGLDGSYEIRTDLTGRFVLLTTSFSYAPQISPDFYGGRTNLLTRDVILDPAAITPRETTLPTGLDSSLAQATSRVTQIAADRLTTRAFLPNELPLAPATILNESGMIGQRAFLSFRGANPDANAVLLDGVPIQPRPASPPSPPRPRSSSRPAPTRSTRWPRKPEPSRSRPPTPPAFIPPSSIAATPATCTAGATKRPSPSPTPAPASSPPSPVSTPRTPCRQS